MQNAEKKGFTRKKIVQVAKQRCVEYRGGYMADIQHYPTDWLVFLDETGCDNRDQIRKLAIPSLETHQYTIVLCTEELEFLQYVPFRKKD